MLNADSKSISMVIGFFIVSKAMKLFKNCCDSQKLGIFGLIEARTEHNSSAINASTERKVGQKGQFWAS